MSRYASARDGETQPRPGWRGMFHTERVMPATLAAVIDAEAYRRAMVATGRHRALRAYNAAREESFNGQSWSWMKPPGRPRFRWVRRTVDLGDGPVEMLELTCAVFAEQAFDRPRDRVTVPA